ncbi:MAG: HlyD family efflux transporter periplasmic adaptor subunit [Bdellovibrio sp.]|nr:HlyD family efflux transporter periplasmic adaptor subunit [Bdellovibrio sp.]
MNKKYLLIALTVVILFVAGAGIFKKRNNFEKIEIRSGQLYEAIYGIGKVKSRKQYELKLGITSSVSKIYVKEGDVIKKGTPLMDFKDAATFFAPFDGTVTYIAADQGEIVFPQTTLLTLTNLEERYIEVLLEQEGAMRAKKGMGAKIVFDGQKGESIGGQLESLYPRGDEFVASIRIDNFSPGVLPGMSADVAIEVGHRDGVLLFPVKAVAGGIALVEHAGERHKVKLKLGASDGTFAEVLEGDVHAGDFALVK